MRREILRRSFVYSFFLLTALPTAAAPRTGAGLLADAPFVRSKTMALAGGDLYLAGEGYYSAAALATYHLDPQTGIPSFASSLDWQQLGVLDRISLVASPDQSFLYLSGLSVAAGQPSIVILRRQGNGELIKVELFGTPGLTVPAEHMAISPDGRHLYAGAFSELAVYERDTATGRLTLRQTIDSPIFGRLLLTQDGATVYAGGRGPALRSYRREANGSLTAFSELDRITAFGLRVDTVLDLAQSPDGRYLYVLGYGLSDSGVDETATLVFEILADGGLALRSRGPGTGGGTEFALGIEVNPRNGTLYMASWDAEDNSARLAAFPPKDGGKDFFGLANSAAAAYTALEFDDFLFPSAALASGDRLYLGNFGGRPLDSWSTAGEAGALAQAASPGLDAYSGLAEMLDYSVSPAGSRILVATPLSGRITTLTWDGEARFESSRPLGNLPFLERVVLLDESRFAALFRGTFEAELQLFELTPQGGVRPLGERFATGDGVDLWTSPDRRQIFVSGYDGFLRFEYRPGEVRLVQRDLPAATSGDGLVRFSADGRQVLVVSESEAQFRTQPYGYDPASGQLVAEPEDAELGAEAIDYAFSPDGHELYVLKASLQPAPMRLQVRRRGPLGSWSVVMQEIVLPPATTSFYRPAQLALDASGRRLAVLAKTDRGLSLFERDPSDGSLRLAETLEGVLKRPEDSAEIAFGPGGNELWIFDPSASRISVSRWGCDPASPAELCLGDGGRFRTEIDWTTAGGRGAAERVIAPATDSGLFYFFDPNNWEMLVKVLDGCGINDRYWVYAAATTDVGYALRVVDTVSGQAKVYRNPLGTTSPAITDGDAFALCPAPAAETAAERLPAGDGADPTTLLLRDRFELEVAWSFGSQTGPARVVPFGSADSGLFYFFSDDNWEMLVKVLDGCAINGHYWLLAAATTDVGYTLELRDLVAGGAPKVYRNPQGQAAPAIIDIGALECAGGRDAGI